jgi:hypothetical protein
MMKALQEVVGKAGSSMSEASKNSILALIDDDASDQTGKFENWCKLIYIDLTTIDAVAITNAKLLGALVKVLPAATAGPLIKYVKISLSISASANLLSGAVCLHPTCHTRRSWALMLCLSSPRHL